MLERGEHVALVGPNGSGKTTLLEAIVGGRRGRIGHGVEIAYFSQHEVELDERGTVLECAMGATGLQRPQAQALLGRFLFSGWDDAREARRRALGRRAAAARARARRRLGRELPRPRRADEPPRPREPRGARGRARGVPGHGPARLARPRPARRGRRADRRDRGRRLRSYDGGWADYVRIRADEDAPPRPPPKERKEKPKPERPSRARPSELERIEASIEARELELAELERQLAEDWGNVDTLAAHRAARDELQALLERWERLFEAAQA